MMEDAGESWAIENPDGQMQKMWELRKRERWLNRLREREIHLLNSGAPARAGHGCPHRGLSYSSTLPYASLLPCFPQRAAVSAVSFLESAS
jgi:hypothetical protein